MQYRPATPADAAMLARMNQQLIQDEHARNRMTLEQLTQRMTGFLAGPYEAVIFAQDDLSVGYALYKREPEWIYLRQFFVKPEYRRKGIGRDAIAWLRANMWHDSPRLRLDVLVGNTTAMAFWRSVGFSDYCLSLELEQAQVRR